MVNKYSFRHVDDIDLFTGGLAEFPVRGGILGSTFACIVAQQFADLRKADRFWYETHGEEGFTVDQLEQIRRVSLSRLLCDNLDLIDFVQPFAFLAPDDNENGRLSCRSLRLPVFTMHPWQENFNGKWASSPASRPSNSSILTKVPELPENLDSPVQELPKPIPVDFME